MPRAQETTEWRRRPHTGVWRGGLPRVRVCTVKRAPRTTPHLTSTREVRGTAFNSQETSQVPHPGSRDSLSGPPTHALRRPNPLSSAESLAGCPDPARAGCPAPCAIALRQMRTTSNGQGDVSRTPPPPPWAVLAPRPWLLAADTAEPVALAPAAQYKAAACLRERATTSPRARLGKGQRYVVARRGLCSPRPYSTSAPAKAGPRVAAGGGVFIEVDLICRARSRHQCIGESAGCAKATETRDLPCLVQNSARERERSSPPVPSGQPRRSECRTPNKTCSPLTWAHTVRRAGRRARMRPIAVCKDAAVSVLRRRGCAGPAVPCVGSRTDRRRACNRPPCMKPREPG